MKIVIELEPDDLTVGARIEDEESPTAAQCLALRDLAVLAGQCRHQLFGSS